MKKNFEILLAALLLLVSVLWVKNYREGAPRRNGFVFDTTRAADVTGLRVRYLRDSMELVTSGKRWWTAGDSFPVDTLRVRKVLGWLLRIQMREKVSDSADGQSLWEYGLDPENAKAVAWTWASGDTTSVLLGKTSSLDYSFTYWKWRDKPAVYRTPGNFIWDVSPRAHDWRERSLWAPFTVANVRAVSVDWRDSAGAMQHYKLERAGDTGFRLTEPLAAVAARDAAEKVFLRAPEFAADDFGLELDPDHDRVSLADPAVVVRILLKNGTTHTLKAGRVFRGYQYTQHPSHRNLVWVFQWRYDYFKKRPEELISPTPP